MNGLKYIAMVTLLGLASCATYPKTMGRDLAVLFKPEMTYDQVMAALPQTTTPPKIDRLIPENGQALPQSIRQHPWRNKLSPEDAAQITYVDRVEVDYGGWITFDVFDFFYDKDGKLVTFWIQEIR